MCLKYFLVEANAPFILHSQYSILWSMLTRRRNIDQYASRNLSVSATERLICLILDVIFLWDCSVYFQILDVLASYHSPSDMSSNVILKIVVLVHFVHFMGWCEFFTNISIPSHLDAGKRNPMTTTRLWHLGTWLATHAFAKSTGQ